MKKLLTLILLFAGAVQAQVTPTLPTGATSYSSQIYRKIAGGDTTYYTGASGKGFVRVPDFLTVRKLQDSIANLRDDLNGKLDTGLSSLDSIPLPKLIFHPYTFDIITDNVLTYGKDGIIAFENQGKFYLVGGWNPAQTPETDNEQWVSEDLGGTWTQLTDAPFTGRHTVATETVNGKTYIVGGDIFNPEYDGDNAKDAWVFNNGVWTEITADAGIGDRVMAELVYHDGAFYLIGGQVSGNPADGVYTSVLKSTDGLETFTQITNSAPFSGNLWGSVVSFNGKIWKVGGGLYSDIISERTYPREIYSSVDGVTWVNEGVFPGVGRSYSQLTVYDEKLFLSHGFNHLEGGNLNDVWVSSDGVTWSQIEIKDITRHAQSAWVYGQSMYWAGGSTNEIAGIVKDVVKLTKSTSLDNYIINSPETVSTDPTPNTIAKRDSRGYLEGVYLRSTNESVIGALPHSITGKTDDGYLYQFNQSGLRTFMGYADVALSADYNDLINKPTIPNADVAFSGSYTDLINKPTSLSQFTNDAGFLVSTDLADVATSGDYTGLINKPDPLLKTGGTTSGRITIGAGQEIRVMNPTGDNWGAIKGASDSGAGLADISITGGSGYGLTILSSGKVAVKSLQVLTGANNGYVLTTDTLGNITPQAPSSGMTYKGVWNASSNSPALADGSGTNGDMYAVSVSGTQFGRSFVAGGFAIYNGSIWQPIGTSSSVTSVNGYTGSPTINPTISGNNIGLDGGSSTISIASAPAITSKEPAITAGTTSQYWRGDKTWQPLADVAITAQYSDLIGKPNISLYAPLNSPAFTGIVTGISASMISGLADVATSAQYSDLLGRPSIPAQTSDLINNSGFITASSTNTFTNKSGNISQWTNNSGYLTASSLSPYAPLASPTFTGTVSGVSASMISGLADVATTAQYSDLIGEPDISLYATKASPTFTGTVSGITKSMVGLGNVDNTSDASKPVSTAQASAIAVVQSDINTHEANTSNPHSVTKAQVGLSNVDNTSDASKPVSTATQTALNLKANISSLATVATTGAYSDLSGKPTLFSGAYADLTGKPTIPTAVSQLTNDSGFITSPAITGKEDVSNKSTSTSLGTSNTLYPTQNAVKTYVDNAVGSGSGTSGTYTPTITAGTNVTGSTAYKAQWSRSGNSVTIFGKISITTGGGTTTNFTISLPSGLTSAFTGADDANGSGVASWLGSSVQVEHYSLTADATADTIQFGGISIEARSRTISYSVMYELK